ncbi:hypothetical protein AAFF_G00178520 [Aldrovandia affinis]|uniref:Uncharacterized protein n=1 Tax=Aldrovandia affinis TaxID=143900 RepID=A0AAD7RNE0_9TELE|nr:hypothetical protein AAFF_G00178520 [Aldrovandia affinis]
MHHTPVFPTQESLFAVVVTVCRNGGEAVRGWAALGCVCVSPCGMHHSTPPPLSHSLTDCHCGHSSQTFKEPHQQLPWCRKPASLTDISTARVSRTRHPRMAMAGYALPSGSPCHSWFSPRPSDMPLHQGLAL